MLKTVIIVSHQLVVHDDSGNVVAPRDEALHQSVHILYYESGQTWEQTAT